MSSDLLRLDQGSHRQSRTLREGLSFRGSPLGHPVPSSDQVHPLDWRRGVSPVWVPDTSGGVSSTSSANIFNGYGFPSYPKIHEPSLERRTWVRLYGEWGLVPPKHVQLFSFGRDIFSLWFKRTSCVAGCGYTRSHVSVFIRVRGTCHKEEVRRNSFISNFNFNLNFRFYEIVVEWR